MQAMRVKKTVNSKIRMLIPRIRDTELRTAKGKVISRSSLVMVTGLFKTNNISSRRGGWAESGGVRGS